MTSNFGLIIYLNYLDDQTKLTIKVQIRDIKHLIKHFKDIFARFV